MKKLTLFFSVMAAFFVAVCSSCQSSAPSVSLSGEWDIVAVKGSVVDTSKVMQAPFIGFNRAENQVYGSASCNRFFGGLELDSVKSEIRFSQPGATRMMCPDMETEDAILSALDKIANYKVVNSNEVDLCDADGQSMLLIRKK